MIAIEQTNLLVGYKSIPRQSIGFSLDSYAVRSYRLDANSPTITLAILACPLRSTYPEWRLQTTQAVVDCFGCAFESIEHMNAFDPLTVLKAGFEAANRYILANRNAARLQETWMQTTFAAAIMVDARLYIASAGQCRMFLVRGDEAWQINTVHSLAERMIELGQITSCEELQGLTHNLNKTYRVMGDDKENIEFEEYCSPIADIPLQADDCLVICSDGVFRECLLQAKQQVLKDCFCNPELDVQLAVERLLDNTFTDPEYCRQSVLALKMP